MTRPYLARCTCTACAGHPDRPSVLLHREARREPPRWHLAVAALVSLLAAALVAAAFLGVVL